MQCVYMAHSAPLLWQHAHFSWDGRVTKNNRSGDDGEAFRFQDLRGRDLGEEALRWDSKEDCRMRRECEDEAVSYRGCREERGLGAREALRRRRGEGHQLWTGGHGRPRREGASWSVTNRSSIKSETKSISHVKTPPLR